MSTEATERNPDPDFMLARLKFQLEVYYHNPDECEGDENGYCVYCTWEYHDSVDQVAHWATTMDDWMSAGERPPRGWNVRTWLEKTEEGKSEFLSLTAAEFECAMRTLGELHDLGAIRESRQYLSAAQADIAERVSAFYGFHGCP